MMVQVIGSCCFYLSCFSKVVDFCCMMVKVIGSYCFYLSSCGFCCVLIIVINDDVDSNLIACAFFCYDGVF